MACKSLSRLPKASFFPQGYLGKVPTGLSIYISINTSLKPNGKQSKVKHRKDVKEVLNTRYCSFDRQIKEAGSSDLVMAIV